jgi:hypothetical protein
MFQNLICSCLQHGWHAGWHLSIDWSAYRLVPASSHLSESTHDLSRESLSPLCLLSYGSSWMFTEPPATFVPLPIWLHNAVCESFHQSQSTARFSPLLVGRIVPFRIGPVPCFWNFHLQRYMNGSHVLNRSSIRDYYNCRMIQCDSRLVWIAYRMYWTL